MKFQAIKSQCNEFPVTLLCQLFGVSKSGYYAWRDRNREEELTEELRVVRLIEDIHKGSRGNYGSPRVHQILLGLGEPLSKSKVARLMNKYGIKAKTKRKFKHTTDSNHRLPVAPNKLDQDYSTSMPGEKLVGDITYVSTGEGWLYLAAVLDVHTRKITGWKLRERMTKDLVVDALKSAIRGQSVAD